MGRKEKTDQGERKEGKDTRERKQGGREGAPSVRE